MFEEDDDTESKLAAISAMKKHIGVEDDSDDDYEGAVRPMEYKKKEKKGGGGGGGMGGMDISKIAGMLGG